MTASIKCKKCSGLGGSIWHEVDGSERGERCDVCDGFGAVEVNTANELVKRAREFVSEAMVENHDPMFARAVLAGQYDNGVSVKAVCKAISAIYAQMGEPQAWIRHCSDGCIEGPIAHHQCEQVRRDSGVWTALYPMPLSIQGAL